MEYHCRTLPETVTPEKAERFYARLAQYAVTRNLATRKETDDIARLRHRKQRYWLRHVRDLDEIIQERLSRMEKA